MKCVKRDCHGNNNGYCQPLGDTMFEFGRECPFYKTVDQYIADQKRTIRKLTEEERYDLVVDNYLEERIKKWEERKK